MFCQKKKGIAIFIAIAAVCLLICSFISFCYGVYEGFVDHFTVETEEEITSVFKENKAYFDSVVKDMSGFECTWDLNKDWFLPSMASSWKIIHVKGGIMLDVREKEYYKDIPIMRKILRNNDGVKKILKDFKFVMLQKRNGYIQFVRHAALGYASGVLYCQGDETKIPYITKLVKLCDSWYYFEEN